MATWWLSTSGTDTNSGTNYANAWKTLVYAIAYLDGNMSAGDTINIVNDGTHVFGVSSNKFVNSIAGTGWDNGNWGFRIRGTDSSGDPAMAEVQISNDNGAHNLWRPQVGSGYFILEGLRFTEAAGAAANGSVTVEVCPIGSSAQDPVWWIRNCAFEFGSEGQAPAGARWLINDTPGPSGVIISNCYIQNIERGIGVHTGDLTFEDNVVVQNATGVDYEVTDGAVDAGDVCSWQRNTFACIVSNASTQIADTFEIRVGMTSNAGTGTCKDNLIFIGTQGDGSNLTTSPTIGGIFKYAAIDHTFTFNTSDVDYNAFLTGPNAGGSVSAWYENPFATGVASTAVKTNDITATSQLATDVFNDITSAYSWTAGSYTIDLPYDLRPKLVTLLTGASDGGAVGALEGANSPPVAGNVTYTMTAQNTLSVTAGDGVLSNSSDPDADTLTATVVTSVSHGSIDSFNTTTGAFEYTPNTTFAGTDQFTFKVYDGLTFSSSASAIITVDNSAPTGQNQSYTTPEGVTLSVTAGSGLLVGASDPDGHTVSVTAIGTPSHGTISGYSTTTGAFTYVPDGFYTGDDSFTFQVTDGITTSASYTASVTVTGTEAPSITNVLDTAPFFKPDLRVATEIRYKSVKNRRKFKDLANYTERDLWDESTHRIITLATNTSTQVTLGGVNTAEYLIVETDNDINVSVNDTNRYWTVSKVVALALTEVSSLYLQNESTTNAAQVILAVAD